jgi:NAD(P)-dependent dehydrogenase (short-subunit alcohol dehydrogenase family)
MEATLTGRLDGKAAIITGATSGIGRATATLFAQEGSGVVITGRRVELGMALQQQIRLLGRAAHSWKRITPGLQTASECWMPP